MTGRPKPDYKAEYDAHYFTFIIKPALICISLILAWAFSQAALNTIAPGNLYNQYVSLAVVAVMLVFQLADLLIKKNPVAEFFQRTEEKLKKAKRYLPDRYLYVDSAQIGRLFAYLNDLEGIPTVQTRQTMASVSGGVPIASGSVSSGLTNEFTYYPERLFEGIEPILRSKYPRLTKAELTEEKRGWVSGVLHQVFYDQQAKAPFAELSIMDCKVITYVVSDYFSPRLIPLPNGVNLNVNVEIFGDFSSSGAGVSVKPLVILDSSFKDA